MRCSNYCLHLYNILGDILAVWINTGVKLLVRLSDRPSYLLTKFGVYILSYLWRDSDVLQLVYFHGLAIQGPYRTSRQVAIFIAPI